MQEQQILAGVAVDAVFDSVSVATTFKSKLEEYGVIFCSISEAVQKHPDLFRKYLGSVVPYSDNKHATLNSAVFTDGTFVYVPPGVRCPMELSTYFRINAAKTGQFERTLIIVTGARTSAISKAAPRRCATKISCMRRWSNWSRSMTPRSSTRPSRTGTRATSRGAVASITSSPSGAPAAAEREDQLDAGGNRLGDHLEISELHPAGRELGQASSTRSP